MTVKGKCCICLSYFKVQLLRYPLCGHTYCIACMSQLKQQRKPNCAVCRHEITPLEGLSQIYLDFEDSGEQERVQHSKSLMKDLGPTSSSKAVLGAARDIQSVAGSSKVDINPLLNAALDLAERIVPMLESSESFNARIEQKDTRIQELERDNYRLGPLEQQAQEERVAQWKLTEALKLSEAKRKLSDARGDRYKKRYYEAMAATEAESRGRNADAAEFRKTIHELESVVSLQKSELDILTNQNRLAKDKLKALRRKSQVHNNRTPKHTSSTADDSLQINDDLIDITDDEENGNVPQPRRSSPGKFRRQSLLVPTPPSRERTLQPVASLVMNQKLNLKPLSNVAPSSSQTSTSSSKPPSSRGTFMTGNPYSTRGRDNLHRHGPVTGTGRHPSDVGQELGVPCNVRGGIAKPTPPPSQPRMDEPKLVGSSGLKRGNHSEEVLSGGLVRKKRRVIVGAPLPP